METVTGYVDKIVFRNDENGYTVLIVSGDEDELTCVGTFPEVNEGERVELEGEYVNHPSYGVQLKVMTCRILAPEGRVSTERYLASGAIRGVGPAMASRIVDKFGDETFRIIEEEPERLVEIKGISERIAQNIAQQVEEKRGMREAMIYLQQYEIPLKLAVKIYEFYGSDIYRILQENPYQMIEDVDGVGFRTADEIAGRIGIYTDSDYRIKSGILYVLMQAAGEGHTYLPEDILTERAGEMLGVDPEDVSRHYIDMAVENKLVLKGTDDGRQIYAAVYFYMEVNVAAMLRSLNVRYSVSDDVIDRRIRKLESRSGIVLDDMQRIAVRESVKNGLLVITGGPGTGKTTAINTIIGYFEEEGLTISLAAPTGRAAKRMTETTGREAKTIHRLLELTGGMEENAGFKRDEQNPLDADVIIVDEMSMVDISLMNSLLKAISVGTRLILVGDANQLPSIGPGCVLQDILDARACSVVMLNHIFRQAAKSDIVVNAHRINRGEEVPLDNKSEDFFFLRRQNADKIIQHTLQLVRDKLPGYVDAEPFDIQVMTPMRKGALGVENLNRILQRYLNPPDPSKAEYERGEDVFRVGDKVMQIKNNYQTEWEIRNRYGIPVETGLGVFNGDMGTIREISGFDESFTVEFEEGRLVEYPFKQTDELELAYAVTIHKAQGSEYPAVVIPLLSVPQMLRTRNLLYTAVTRARRCVVILGDERIFAEMEANTSVRERYSGLKDRMIELELQKYS